MVLVSKISDIHVNSLQYSAPRTNASGGQTIYVTQSNKKIVIALPRCRLPFGISDYNGRKSLQFSLKNDCDKILQFKDFLTQLDLNNVQTAVNNSSTWFKKVLPHNTIQTLYNPSLKQNNDSYPPVFRARLPINPDNGQFIGDIFDSNRKPISQDCIKPSCEVEAIVELVGIYFVAKEFGVSWKVIQLKVYPPQRLQGYSFLCDSDSDDDQSDAEPN